jgi:protein-S-isoprenylcysteine O-methyltransferase Ste14
MIPWIFFALLSAAILYVSRTALRHPRSHGFYRFFAWECIAGLAALQLEGWFRDPFSWHQMLSWILLMVCFIPLGLGLHGLAARGKANRRRAGDASLLAFEKTTALVTMGIYRWIRHPLYSSLLLLAWGIFFKAPGWEAGLLAAAASLFLTATARADEAECLEYFGAAYAEYMRRTRRFIPYLF